MKAPEGFDCSFRVTYEHFGSAQPNHRHSTEQPIRVPAAAGEQIETGERILLTAHKNGVPKGAAINIFTVRL